MSNTPFIPQTKLHPLKIIDWKIINKKVYQYTSNIDHRNLLKNIIINYLANSDCLIPQHDILDEARCNFLGNPNKLTRNLAYRYPMYTSIYWQTIIQVSTEVENIGHNRLPSVLKHTIRISAYVDHDALNLYIGFSIRDTTTPPIILLQITANMYSLLGARHYIITSDIRGQENIRGELT